MLVYNLCIAEMNHSVMKQKAATIDFNDYQTIRTMMINVWITVHHLVPPQCVHISSRQRIWFVTRFRVIFTVPQDVAGHLWPAMLLSPKAGPYLWHIPRTFVAGQIISSTSIFDILPPLEIVRSNGLKFWQFMVQFFRGMLAHSIRSLRFALTFTIVCSDIPFGAIDFVID